MTDISTTPKRISVAIAILCGDEVLLTRSRNSSLWKFVGGRVKPEERPGIALGRRIVEKTGVHIDISKKGPLYDIHDEGRMLHFFAVEVPEGTFDNLPKKGPNGHDIMRCKRADLMKQDLDIDHETCLRKVAERNAKAARARARAESVEATVQK
jgi:ADP-ribose pyrophosphatase YjhB (NUDIX family)